MSVASILSALPPPPAQHLRGRPAALPLAPDVAMTLGPLAAIFADDDVTEIMINGPGPVWLDRGSLLCRSDVELDRAAIEHLVERLVAPLGRRVDRASPLVDARLADGSRIHVAVPPLAVDGPYVTIRRFRRRRVALSEMAGPAVAALLSWAVKARRNVLVVGPTSSGKTTLLNAMASQITAAERVVTIEDAAELDLDTPHVVRLEARPATVDGPGPVSIRELVRTSLRMRPDRIIVGECRGGEALDMVEAMNTGHDGSMSTCHANTEVDALRRLEIMMLRAATGLPLEAVRSLMHRTLDLVVVVRRHGDGSRCVDGVAEPSLDDAGVRPLVVDGVLTALPGRPDRASTALLSHEWIGQR